MEKIKHLVEWRTLLLEQYKRYGLSEEETMLIYMIDDLQQNGIEVITADNLAKTMTLSRTKIDKILASLIDREIINFDETMKLSLEKLFLRLTNDFKKDVIEQQLITKANKNIEENTSIFLFFQELFQRTLSALEVGKIKDWIDNGYLEDQIKVAANNIKQRSSRVTLLTIGKELETMSKRDDFAKEGFTVKNSEHQENIDEAIEIAKYKWIADD